MEDRFFSIEQRLPALHAKFRIEDMKPMVSTESLKKFAEFDTAVQEPFIDLAVAGFRSNCTAVGRFSRFIKGCPCHRAAFAKARTPHQRSEALKAAGLKGGACPWMGRPAVELVHGGAVRLCHMVKHYQSNELKATVAKTDPKLSGPVLKELESIQSSIANEYDMKILVPWTNLPNTLMGMFGEGFGHTLEAMNDFIQGLCDEYDAMLEKDKCHRRIRQALDPASRIRQMLNFKLTNKTPLVGMLDLWMYCGEIAFLLVHSSRNEGQHRTIKTDTRSSMVHPLPAYVGSHQRWPDLESAASDESFLHLSSMYWAKRGEREVAVSLLNGPYKVAELKVIGQKRKWARIYQYANEDLGVDTTDMSLAIVLHKQDVLKATCPPLAIGNSAQACVNLLKIMLKTGSTFAIPMTFFALIADRSGEQEGGAAAIECEPMDLVAVAASFTSPTTAVFVHDHVMFTVVNPYPERKVQGLPGHLRSSRAEVRLVCHVAAKWRGPKVIVHKSECGPTSVDLVPWCTASIFKAVLSELIVFEHAGSSVMPELVPSVDAESMRLGLSPIKSNPDEAVTLARAGESVLVPRSHNDLARLVRIGCHSRRFRDVIDLDLKHEEIVELSACGALDTQDDGFGAMQVSANLNSFRFTAVSMYEARELHSMI